jgi:hypothetical protein
MVAAAAAAAARGCPKLLALLLLLLLLLLLPFLTPLGVQEDGRAQLVPPRELPILLELLDEEAQQATMLHRSATNVTMPQPAQADSKM